MKRGVVMGLLVLGMALSMASPAAASSCSGNHPFEKTNARFRGFLLVCSDLLQRSLVIRNESTIVWTVSPMAGSTVRVNGNPDDTLLGAATRLAAPATCFQRRSCTLQPGGWATAVSTYGNTVANALIDSDPQKTRVTLAARLVAGQIERRLRPKARANILSVIACADSIANTIRYRGWEDAFRSTVNVATSCPSLMKRIGATPAEEKALGSRVSRVGARIIGQEGFVDVVLSGIKAILRR